MLNYLAVKNVSVIESVSMELGAGLTVLTGETGSGKSVLVNSLKLLLGERFQKNMLREGADKLLIEGIFDETSHLPQELRDTFTVEDELIIRREVNEAGKNRIFINGVPATVAQLKEFAPYLADIHGQHEHQTLLDESRHLELVDNFVPRDILDSYSGKYKNYQSVKAERDRLLAETDEVQRYQDTITYQVREIESAEINPQKDADLEDQVNFMAHAEKIREACVAALGALTDGEMNAVELMAVAMRSLDTVSGVVNDAAAANDAVAESAARLDEAVKILTALYERQDTSSEELDRLIQRKFLLQDLIKKYGGTLEDVLATCDKLKAKLDSFENNAYLLEKLDKRLADAEKEAAAAADVLLEARKKASVAISEDLVKILADLELPASRFETVFTRANHLNAAGGVEGRFYISVNPGFEPAPLVQVASGGEISRVMLALKEVFGKSDPVPTMLFDEIDTGISGKAARKVALKLGNLAKHKQILVITHLPVVAATGSDHFLISKSAEDGSAKTSIVKLGIDERRRALASMISGEATETALKQADELLKNTKE